MTKPVSCFGLKLSRVITCIYKVCQKRQGQLLFQVLAGYNTTLPLGQNMRPNRLSYMYKSGKNTVLFVNVTIGFSENLFLVRSVDPLSWS